MELIREPVGTVRQAITSTFDSLDSFADAVERQHARGCERAVGRIPADVPTALEMARYGWADRLDETLNIAESAVELTEREHVVYRVTSPAYDVAGGMVDVGRYLTRDPGCMQHYSLNLVSTAGRVVALCAPVTWSGAVSDETIIKRGQVITALALALTRPGHQCELWTDRTNTSASEGKRTRIRVLVKGANDEVDPARIPFAFAHPDMLHKMCWTYDSRSTALVTAPTAALSGAGRLTLLRISQKGQSTSQRCAPTMTYRTPTPHLRAKWSSWG